jgi:hypothetical protein
MAICDCEPADLIVERIKTARKVHKCCSCRESIEKSERYTQIDYIYEGSWYHDKLCLNCDALYKWLLDRSDCCIGFSQIYEELLESEFITVSDRTYRSLHPELEIVENKVRLKDGTRN